jgi:class 3 adenylate cyclase
MPRIPIFRLGQSSAEVDPPRLASYAPALTLDGLRVGIDNLRYDVHLSPRFVENARVQLARLIAYHGEVGHMLAAEAPAPSGNRSFNWNLGKAKPAAKAEPSDLKTLLVELQVVGLNRAKTEGSPVVDLLARLAVIKFLRVELQSQFNALLERCRIMLKSLEGVRQQRALEYREQVAGFQVRKKIILRKVGQELFLTLREIEKETLARTRRSYFGDVADATYKLFLNRLIFSDDGRDDYLSAEHYVMFGNFDKDIDRFSNIRAVVVHYLRSLELAESADEDAVVDGWLNVPENAQELVASGTPDESRPEGRAQKDRLAAWVGLLSDQGVIDHVIASYEVVPLLAEYSPRINAQQLKNALISRAECDRVEKLIEQHGKLTADSLYSAVGRTVSCRGGERSKIAGRYLRDFMKYHRDFRSLEVLSLALDSVNLIGNEKLLELSKVNGTLYEFLLAEEQKPSEEKVRDHVIIKADVRDSTRLTRTLVERGLNPASFFSLNFYDPVNKLLSKYTATKVFIEGDAIILAIMGREGETSLAVSRASVLAREMVEIVRGYNELLARSGLPSIELGLGISYVQSAPLFLMDGEQRIMISDAINESDRLSSCNKRARQVMEKMASPFRVYAFQTVSDADAAGSAEDFAIAYNLGGVRINQSAFGKLKQEISLEPCQMKLPSLWGSEPYRLFRGLVPIGNDIFRKIVVRESKVALIDPKTFTLVKWSDRSYYEVCTAAEIYSLLEAAKAAEAK